MVMMNVNNLNNPAPALPIKNLPGIPELLPIDIGDDAVAPAGDQNAVQAGPLGDALDVNIEEIKLETLGAAVRKAVLNDNKIDPKERKFIEDLTHYLWPGTPGPKPVNPGGGAGPTPAATSWPVGTDKLTAADGKTFSSVGDPHETTGDSVKFDNMLDGTFIKAKSATGDFELQTTQGKDKSGRWPGATLNQKAAVKSGKDVVAYDGLEKSLQINGQKVDVASLPKTLADGGKVEKTADGIKITTGKADVVEIHQRDAYIDVTGTVGDRADGEVRGSLGAFDKGTDGSNDLLGRTGTKPIADKNAFFEEWRVKAGEDLTAANPGGGAGPTPTPVPVPVPSPLPPVPVSPWSVGADDLTDADGKGFSSVGDPHETSGDNLHFDNVKTGTFIKAKSASGDFELQATQGKDASGRWPNATLNHSASVKSGKDVVAYDGLAKTLKINGQAVDVASLPKTLADGGKVEKTADGIKITTGKNDVVEIHQRDAYIDISGKVGNRKDGEVRGSLGAFDKGTDGGNDLLGRTGNTPVKDQDAFLEEWRVKPGENLNDNPGGGAGPKDDIDKEFDKLDKTGEGYLSGNEIPAGLKAYYPGKDRIDRADFRAWKTDKGPNGGGVKDAIDEEFNKLDKTGEGYLSGNEITPELKAAFPGKDRITRDEFRAFKVAQADAAAEAAAVAQDEADFAKLDITGDGWLSGTEAKGSEKYDKGNNFKGKDGQEIKEITKEEFMAGRKAERAAKKAAAAAGGANKAADVALGAEVKAALPLFFNVVDDAEAKARAKREAEAAEAAKAAAAVPLAADPFGAINVDIPLPVAPIVGPAR